MLKNPDRVPGSRPVEVGLGEIETSCKVASKAKNNPVYRKYAQANRLSPRKPLSRSWVGNRMIVQDWRPPTSYIDPTGMIDRTRTAQDESSYILHQSYRLVLPIV